MASAPRWKIYTADGMYIGCLKHVEDCARVVAGIMGHTIRDGHRKVVWTEGSEAAKSYDEVVRVIHERTSASNFGKTKDFQ